MNKSSQTGDTGNEKKTRTLDYRATLCESSVPYYPCLKNTCHFYCYYNFGKRGPIFV